MTSLLLSFTRLPIRTLPHSFNSMRTFHNLTKPSTLLRPKILHNGSSKYSKVPGDSTPLNVNANVRKDTLLFKFENPVFFRNMTIFGILQFGFWMYLTGFTYTTLKDVSPEEENKMMGLDEDSLPWWRKINLGNNKYRNGLATMCALLGTTVLGITLAYPSRAVRSLKLLKGGASVQIETYSIFKQSRLFTTDLDSVSCLHSRMQNKPQIAMKVKGRWLFFMLDNRGEFQHVDIFDYVVGLRRAF